MGGGGGGIAQSPSVSLGDTVGTDFNTDPQQAPAFYDITSVPWAYDSIIALAKRGVISGYGDGSFKPNNNITREEVVKIIVESFSLLDKEATCDFNDVLPFEWYAGYVASAYNRGVVSGLGNGSFGVGMPVSRQDMATMLHRVVINKNIQKKKSVEMPLFADASSISNYAVDAVKYFCETGVMNGTDKNLFSPKEVASRAMAAKVVYMIIVQ